MFVMSNKAMAFKRAILTVVLYVVAVLTLAGCGSILEPANIPETPAPSVTVSASVEKPAKPAMESIKAIATMKEMNLGTSDRTAIIRMYTAHNPYDVA